MKRSLLLAMVVLGVLLSSCAPTAVEPITIRVAVLPILDCLPLYIADAQGYFSEEGLMVELVPVTSGPERDQLMQAGQIDAMINEIVSVLFYNKEEINVVAVRTARTATEEYPLFRIVASQESGITSVDQLKDIPIGISEGTVIEYTTDRILEHAGLKVNEIEKIAVPKIPDRLNLLASGQLQAANLPDPAASFAILNGATLVIDDTTYPEISQSIISFSAEFTRSQPDALRGFLRAVEKAVNDINEDKASWNTLLMEKGLIPPPLLESYELPDYPTASVPSEAQFADAMQWALDKGLITGEIDYASSVDASYLP